MIFLVRNIVLILAVFSFLLWIFQEKVIFFPFKQAEKLDLPQVPGIQARDITIKTADGLNLGAVLLTAVAPSAGTASGSSPAGAASSSTPPGTASGGAPAGSGSGAVPGDPGGASAGAGTGTSGPTAVGTDAPGHSAVGTENHGPTAVGTETAGMAAVGGRPFLLFSHGNGGNLYYNLERAYTLVRQLNVDLLLYDYRGFGRSEGTPDTAGVIRDGEAVLDYVLNTLKVPSERLILYGVSLGTGVTATMLRKNGMKCAGVVFESGFRSLAAMAGNRFPVIGPLVLRGNLPSDEIYGAYQGPFQVIHSRNDEVIGFWHGEAIYQVCPSVKKSLYTMTAVGHNDPVWRNPEYIKTWATFLGGIPSLQDDGR